MATSVDEQAQARAQVSASSDAVPGSAAPGRPVVERFWNLPNTITMMRMLVVPVLLFLPMAESQSASRVIAWLFIVAALTDILDGWLARRGQMVTSIGKLLDPLVDKLTVSTALVVLLAMGRIPIWASVMVVVIIGRELAVTGLRGVAAAGGLVVAAGSLGKWKTTCQNIAIGALIFHYPTFGLPAHEIGMIFLTIATAFTLWSGYQYFADYFGSRTAAG